LLNDALCVLSTCEKKGVDTRRDLTRYLSSDLIADHSWSARHCSYQPKG